MLYFSQGHGDGHPLVAKPLTEPSHPPPLCGARSSVFNWSRPHEGTKRSPKNCATCMSLVLVLLVLLLLVFTQVNGAKRLCQRITTVQPRPLRTNLMGQCLCTDPYPPVTDTGPQKKKLLFWQCPDSVQINDRYEGLMSRFQVYISSGNPCNRSIDCARFSMIHTRNLPREQDVNRPQDPSLPQHVEPRQKASKSRRSKCIHCQPSIAQKESSPRGT